MANHTHRQIREAVETLLTGLSTTGSKVYANRLQPMADANLPGLRIFMDEEEIDEVTAGSPQLLYRSVALIVECCAKASANLDDTLDASSKEVEAALSADITIGTHKLETVYAGMQFDDLLADKPAGVKRLRFFVKFVTASNAPDVFV